MRYPIRLRTEEVKHAFVSFKNGKSPGLRSIPAELMKNYPKKLYEHLKKLFQDCLNEDKIPQVRNVASLSTIHKKGTAIDVKIIGNSRNMYYL